MILVSVFTFLRSSAANGTIDFLMAAKRQTSADVDQTELVGFAALVPLAVFYNSFGVVQFAHFQNQVERGLVDEFD